MTSRRAFLLPASLLIPFALSSTACSEAAKGGQPEATPSNDGSGPSADAPLDAPSGDAPIGDASVPDLHAPAVDASVADAPSDCACGTGDLEAWCADAGNDFCPPGLKSAGYEAWIRRHTELDSAYGTPSYAGCGQVPGCPSAVYIEFGQGVDCGELFVFDESTGSLLAAEFYCSGTGCSHTHVSGCIPSACIPTWSRWGNPSSLCPRFEAGTD